MRRSLIVSTLILFGAGRGAAPLGVDDSDRFTGLDASPLAAAVIVGVGESIHLSGGLERARGRLTRHLVEEHGFDTLAVEVSWAEARLVDARYQACLRGEDALQEAVADPLWDGVLLLLEQLCETRLPLRVIGTDIQDTWSHRALLDPDWQDPALGSCHGGKVRSARELRQWGVANGFPAPTAAQTERCLTGLAARVPRDATEALAIASVRANQLRAEALLAQQDVGRAYNIREEAMFDVLQRERERVGAGRTVLLAHDGHVSYVAEQYTPIGARIRDARLPYRAISVTGYRVQTRYGAAHDPPAPRRGPLKRWYRDGHAFVFARARQSAGHDFVLFVSEAFRNLDGS